MDKKLERMIRAACLHGHDAWLNPWGGVDVKIAWSHRDGRKGFQVFSVKTWEELRIALGY